MLYKTSISGAISRRSQGRGQGKNYKNWQHVELLPHGSRAKIHYRRRRKETNGRKNLHGPQLFNGAMVRGLKKKLQHKVF